jgi:hypothetical protein
VVYKPGDVRKRNCGKCADIENIFLQNIKVGTYKDAAITCDMFYENPGSFIPVVRNIWVEELDVADGGAYAVAINAYEQSPVQNLQLVNCNIRGVKTPVKINYVKGMQLNNVKINEKVFVLPDSLSAK